MNKRSKRKCHDSDSTSFGSTGINEKGGPTTKKINLKKTKSGCAGSTLNTPEKHNRKISGNNKEYMC